MPTLVIVCISDGRWVSVREDMNIRMNGFIKTVKQEGIVG